MAWPTVLNDYERISVFHIPTAWDEEIRAAKCERIAFFRKAGSRRLGSTEFFMMAKDPGHPSRQLRPEDDLPYELIDAMKRLPF